MKQTTTTRTTAPTVTEIAEIRKDLVDKPHNDWGFRGMIRQDFPPHTPAAERRLWREMPTRKNDGRRLEVEPW